METLIKYNLFLVAMFLTTPENILREEMILPLEPHEAEPNLSKILIIWMCYLIEMIEGGKKHIKTPLKFNESLVEVIFFLILLIKSP